MSRKEQSELDKEAAAFGLVIEREEPPDIEVWEEHRDALTWWMEIRDLLRWTPSPIGSICDGLDVQAVEADARMRGRTINPDDYARVRLIAATVADHFNERLQ
ncbi:DUF1799 domain-containing protein [Gallaecimonas kandeliae]|uniref:DUF1799 domain-containing protein n=1 Tax=Gallaecimonas kandeliae TaxID=3029055 RepID=UPI002647CD7A|nr:DUF1799 domain-containing protein [Gallaecimonas kandeliae]WKE64333.1 DUF1799 domain-containing protein [Gallaecimonas kandeliae]